MRISKGAVKGSYEAWDSVASRRRGDDGVRRVDRLPIHAQHSRRHSQNDRTIHISLYAATANEGGVGSITSRVKIGIMPEPVRSKSSIENLARSEGRGDDGVRRVDRLPIHSRRSRRHSQNDRTIHISLYAATANEGGVGSITSRVKIGIMPEPVRSKSSIENLARSEGLFGLTDVMETRESMSRVTLYPRLFGVLKSLIVIWFFPSVGRLSFCIADGF